VYAIASHVNQQNMGEYTPNAEKVFPPAPVNHLDWTKLGVGVVRQVNGHIQSTWTELTGEWSEPRFVNNPKLEISGLASGLNYGMQAYEGIKAVRDSAGHIRIFRPDMHASRMQHSCQCVSIPKIPTLHFQRCVSLAVSLNAEFVPPCEAPAALYIRPMAFGSGGQLNIIPPNEFTFCVFVQPTGALLGHAAPVSALVLEEYDRAAPRGTGSAKVGGNYAPMMRWQRKAKEEGYGITLHLDSQTQTQIEEFSAAGFIAVRNIVPSEGDGGAGKYTLIVPDSATIIQSVTSDSCIQLAKALGWEVQVRPVLYDELKTFDEVLAVGTAAVVVPIKSITRKSRSETILYEQESNGCFNILFQKILDVQRGVGDFSGLGWSVVVDDPSAYGTKSK